MRRPPTGPLVPKADAPRWRRLLYEVIFEADTFSGRLFDVGLILTIGLSVATVMLDSVEAINADHGGLLYGIEWFFTILFTIEYILRLLCVRRPGWYATSFFGAVDLVAIVPTYLSIFVPGSQYLLVIRVLRVVRVFRVLKLAQYLGESNLLVEALRASRHKVVVFLVAVLSLVIILGSLMYLVEGRENGFTSLPRSVYWAIVTMTTVGYGDISPQTDLGQVLAAVIMIIGYGIIAVPTGIVTVELSHASERRHKSVSCPSCRATGHDADAKHCKYCGGRLDEGRGEA